MKTLLLILILFNELIINAQTILTLKGGSYSNSDSIWLGVPFSRSVRTTFTFRDNYITSTNIAGSMLHAGDESKAITNNNLDGMVITGNKLSWKGTYGKPAVHGIFTANNINFLVKYNYIDAPSPFVAKSSSSMVCTSGGFAYNIVRCGLVGTIVKGISGAKIYNNTYYQDKTPELVWRGLIDIYTNTDDGIRSISHDTKIFNNIFYAKYGTPMIYIEDTDGESLKGFESDYNVFYCETAEVRFRIGDNFYNFEQWQSLGYDKHSVVVNPDFRDLISFVPKSRLNYGTDLDSLWSKGLSTKAKWGKKDPKTSAQNHTWQVGAVIYASGSSRSLQDNKSGIDKKYALLFNSLSVRVDKDRLRKAVFYLSKDPLPRRVLNWSLPGHNLSSLDEADAWIIQQLKNSGYAPETDSTKVKAYGRDFSQQPVSQQYARPSADAPWYTAHNIIAGRSGTDYPEKAIIILAHKDSQSWIDSPGANDNAIGTCGALELALVLKDYKPKHTIRFIFCNEEHTPWTSITAAKTLMAEGIDALAVINLDGIGVKSPDKAGTLTNVTRFTTPEGERLAEMMTKLNKRFAIGLDQTTYRSEKPDDDDGSFIKEGFIWAVANCGSNPYGDPNYHNVGDVPEKVDIENAALTIKLTLAAILYLDTFGRP
jgi:hypothetical protein